MIPELLRENGSPGDQNGDVPLELLWDGKQSLTLHG